MRSAVVLSAQSRSILLYYSRLKVSRNSASSDESAICRIEIKFSASLITLIKQMIDRGLKIPKTSAKAFV